MWKVYGLSDPRDGRIRYVGCTTLPLLSSRLAAHVDQSKFPQRRGYTSARAVWIREVLAAGKRPTIVLLQSAFTADEGAEVERQWIERLGDLVNQSPGGPGLPDPSPAVRAKLSAAQRRIWSKRSVADKAGRIAKMRANAWTSEANAKRAASNTGRKMPPEAIAKMRAAKLGTTHSAETRARMAASQKARRARERLP